MNAPAVKIYHPEQASRRGEATAWGLAVLVAAAWLILLVLDQPVPGAVRVMCILLAIFALGISLSNWMDRKTTLIMRPVGIEFTNGLRHVSLTWDQVCGVQVYFSQWGKKVSVVGERQHFDFRTLGEVKVQGEVKGRLGFLMGETILAQVLESAGLRLVSSSDKEQRYERPAAADQANQD